MRTVLGSVRGCGPAALGFLNWRLIVRFAYRGIPLVRGLKQLALWNWSDVLATRAGRANEVTGFGTGLVCREKMYIKSVRYKRASRMCELRDLKRQWGFAGWNAALLFFLRRP